MKTACILVNLDIREGFKEDMLLNIDSGTQVQLLDYVGIPFWHQQCHSRGHLKS